MIYFSACTKFQTMLNLMMISTNQIKLKLQGISISGCQSCVHLVICFVSLNEILTTSLRLLSLSTLTFIVTFIRWHQSGHRYFWDQAQESCIEETLVWILQNICMCFAGIVYVLLTVPVKERLLRALLVPTALPYNAL